VEFQGGAEQERRSKVNTIQHSSQPLEKVKIKEKTKSTISNHAKIITT